MSSSSFEIDIGIVSVSVLVSHINKGITNMLAFPIDKMLYIYLVCPHSEHQNNPFQSKQSINTFTKETGSPDVKLVLIR